MLKIKLKKIIKLIDNKFIKITQNNQIKFYKQCKIIKQIK